MPWMIEKVKGVRYDRMTNTLKDGKGYEIARIFEEEDGGLFISLAMPTNFIYENGVVAVGWNGDDIHVGTFIRLDNTEGIGGTLKYCENRFSDKCYQGIGNEEISIRINIMEGYIIPPKTMRMKRRNIFRRFFEGLWDFISSQEEKCLKKI